MVAAPSSQLSLGVVNGIDLDEHRAMVKRQARALLGKHTRLAYDAEDLEQIGLLALLDAAKRFSPDRQDFAVWAQFTVRNRMKDELRRLSWVPRIELRRLQGLGEQPRTQMASSYDEGSPLDREPCRGSELAQDFDARCEASHYLRLLSGRDRVVAHARFVEGQTYREIGERLGVTECRAWQLCADVEGVLRRFGASSAAPGSPSGESVWSPAPPVPGAPRASFDAPAPCLPSKPPMPHLKPPNDVEAAEAHRRRVSENCRAAALRRWAARRAARDATGAPPALPACSPAKPSRHRPLVIYAQGFEVHCATPAVAAELLRHLSTLPRP